MIIKPIDQNKFLKIFQKYCCNSFVQKLINQKKTKIIKEKGELVDLKIKVLRAYYSSPQRFHKFVIRYRVKFKLINGDVKDFNIYAKAQDNIHQKDVKKVMEILLKNSFSEGRFRVQRPLFLQENGMVLFYQELLGRDFLGYFKKPTQEIEDYIRLAAQLLDKIHRIDFSSYFPFPSSQSILEKNIAWAGRNIISLGRNLHLDEIQEEFLPLLKKRSKSLRTRIKPCLVHNDFSPDNIIIHEDYLGLLDFSIYKFADPVEDLVSFMVRLIMIALRVPQKTYGHLSLSLKEALKLNRIFLKEYIGGTHNKNLLKRINFYTIIYFLGFAQYTLDFENNKEGAKALINKAKEYAEGFHSFAHL